MRILFLTPQLPHPPVSGGVIKSRKMIDFLADRHDVCLFCLLKGEDSSYADEYKSKAHLSQFHCVPLSISRSTVNFLCSLFVGVPLSVYRNRSPELLSKLQSMFSWADVIFIDHFLMFQYIPEFFKGRIVLHQHNAEYIMWERFAGVEKNIFRKLLVTLEAKRIREYEASIVNRSHAVLAAPNDIKALASIGIPRERFIETLHLGDEELLKLPDIDFKNTELRILFIGSLDWEANSDGVYWFLRDVWPRLISKHLDLQFSIIGRNPSEKLIREAQKYRGVEVLGFIEDLNPYYERSRVFVTPLRFGSGIKVKVINALYRGLPVSTTSVGSEGLTVEDGCEMYIADDANEMAKEISTLLTNESLWVKFRDAGRELARKEYTWHKCLVRVEEAIHG